MAAVPGRYCYRPFGFRKGRLPLGGTAGSYLHVCGRSSNGQSV